MNDEVLADAHSRRDVAVLAAAARAGVTLPLSYAPTLAPLTSDGMRVIEAADDHVLVQIDDEVAADPDGKYAPRTVTTPKIRKAFVALLAATRDPDSLLPYPGRWALVSEVVELTRPSTTMGARHIVGAVRTLAALGYGVLSDDETQVRPGPQLAGWDDTWVRTDLPLLLDRLGTP